MRKVLLITIGIISLLKSTAQDTSMLQLLNDSMPENNTVTGIFKATQIINTPTVEAPAARSLQFMIMHRFGKINEGAYALFGLDNAAIRFALDYGVTKNLAIGVGRSSLDKVYDASFKWRLMQQKKGVWPLTVSLYSLLVHNTLKYSDKPYLNAKFRTSYATQLLLANKVTPSFSWQLTPTWLHFNLVRSAKDNNDVFALGVGGRLKLTKRLSINTEYNWLPDGQVESENVYNSFSIGADLETGGHVFQLIFTNAAGMTAPYYIAQNRGSWGNGDIYFGFNITRIFHFRKNP